MTYPVKLPYLIAETVKGYGFYGAGSNAAHGTPLPAIPKFDEISRRHFHESVAQLFMPESRIHRAREVLATHHEDSRPAEKDHPLGCRNVKLQMVPNRSGCKPVNCSRPCRRLMRSLSPL